MLRAQKLTENTGQQYVVLTPDQQLCSTALQIIWHDLLSFKNIFLELGGMHILMSYVGHIGILMENTGMAEFLTRPFGGLIKC